MGLKHVVDVIHGRIREHAKRGAGITNKLAQAVTGEGPRSPHWPVIEKRWKQTHPNCAACGGTEKIQVHHKVPFKHDPSLELHDGTGIPPATGDADGHPNLISLCEGSTDKHHHHLLVGHGDNFQFANLAVEQDAAELKASPEHAAVIYARAKLNRVKS